MGKGKRERVTGSAIVQELRDVVREEGIPWRDRKIAELEKDLEFVRTAYDCRLRELSDALRRICDWSEAYPVDVFPEPKTKDAERANKLLRKHGMTVDCFSASMARHCLKGVREIAQKVLGSSRYRKVPNS
jgi:hypothetical protein